MTLLTSELKQNWIHIKKQTCVQILVIKKNNTYKWMNTNKPMWYLKNRNIKWESGRYLYSNEKKMTHSQPRTMLRCCLAK
jgi:Gpi18-like mannosyltransferase